MCGIAGLITKDPQPRIDNMLESIEHRGRDDQGVWISPLLRNGHGIACLGHRRLSIIDTSAAGHQPMVSRDGRFAITFNGEIYNYKDLRTQLQALGRSFQTNCDTEVLL